MKILQRIFKVNPHAPLEAQQAM